MHGGRCANDFHRAGGPWKPGSGLEISGSRKEGKEEVGNLVARTLPTSPGSHSCRFNLKDAPLGVKVAPKNEGTESPLRLSVGQPIPGL
jgi:hypothetical protein